MPLDLLQTHALGGVAGQQAADEVHHLRGEVDREIDGDLQNFIIGLVLVGLGLEGSLASTQLIAEDTQTPNVGLFIVELPSNDLRRDVVEGPAEGLPLAE